MKQALEHLALLISVTGGLCAAVLWLYGQWERKMRRREDAKVKAREIEARLKQVESNLLGMDGKHGQAVENLTDQIHELRRDFSELLQKLLFNK